jgi:hypothetical protein
MSNIIDLNNRDGASPGATKTQISSILNTLGIAQSWDRFKTSVSEQDPSNFIYESLQEDINENLNARIEPLENNFSSHILGTDFRHSTDDISLISFNDPISNSLYNNDNDLSDALSSIANKINLNTQNIGSTSLNGSILFRLFKIENYTTSDITQGSNYYVNGLNVTTDNLIQGQTNLYSPFIHNTPLNSITLNSNLYSLINVGQIKIGNSPGSSIDLGLTTNSIRIPTGTTFQRPATPSPGMLRYNTTLKVYELYDELSLQWQPFGKEVFIGFYFDSTTGDLKYDLGIGNEEYSVENYVEWMTLTGAEFIIVNNNLKIRM